MKKNKISSFVKGSVLSVGLVIASSCNLEDHLINPSALSPEQASIEYIFNSVQLGTGGLYLTATQFGMDNTRMTNMFGSTYESAYNADNFDGLWSNAYQDVMVNANLLLSKTKENAGTAELEYNAYYQGVGRIFKAYAMMLLVDYFGDVPYSEALNPSQFHPVADPGSNVYDSAKVLLDEAVVHMTMADATGSPVPSQDLLYGGDPLKWRKLANTLLMKWHLQRRLIDATGSNTAIAALIAGGDIIGPGDDFIFTAPANSQSNPNTYHPWFFSNYFNGAGQYMSNSYMKELFDAKGFKDPRIRYYFYRQQDYETSEVNELQCLTSFPPNHYPPGTAFCQVPEGYWGRDHLNFEGTPPDGFKRTVYGLYPAGGKFDTFTNDGLPEEAPVSDEKLSSGAKGVGILPIMMHSFVLFMKAEYELTLIGGPGGAAAARVTLNQAVRASIDYVMEFNNAADDDAFEPSATGINNYVAAVLADYDAGAAFSGNGTVTPDDKLDVIVKEYYLALWGNGIESYNTVRRTGRPSNLQPALAQFPGEFYRTFSYPASYVVRNNNATPKLTPSGTADNTIRVFWDNNPAGFIK